MKDLINVLEKGYKNKMSEEEKILLYIEKEYGNYDNYVRDLLDLYKKEKNKYSDDKIRETIIKRYYEVIEKRLYQ